MTTARTLYQRMPERFRLARLTQTEEPTMRIKNMSLFVQSMGKLLKVEAVFPDTEDGAADANRMMESHDQLAVVAATDGLILLADKYFPGHG